MAGAARDAATGAGDGAAAHVAAVVEQRRRAGGAAHHLQPSVPEQQAQRRHRRDNRVQLLPQGRGWCVQALPGPPPFRPTRRRPRAPVARGPLLAGGHAVPGVARRAAGRLRRVRGLRQHGHLRRTLVPGARRGAGAHRPTIPVGGPAGLHPGPEQAVAG
uniref:Uncharacterized protein n=1 Tax=Oryza brachyantha TaxID=4533 RepID=J3LSZ2_ORYBR